MGVPLSLSNIVLAVSMGCNSDQWYAMGNMLWDYWERFNLRKNRSTIKGCFSTSPKQSCEMVLHENFSRDFVGVSAHISREAEKHWAKWISENSFEKLNNYPYNSLLPDFILCKIFDLFLNHFYTRFLLFKAEIS